MLCFNNYFSRKDIAVLRIFSGRDLLEGFMQSKNEEEHGSFQVNGQKKERKQSAEWRQEKVNKK